MKKTRIAIVGAGRIAHVHADAYLAMPDVAVVAVADPDGERAELLAKRANADVSKDYAELLSRDDIEAIDVCTPTVFHEEITIAALKAGKHVCCQKPFSLDLGSCDRMIAAAKDAGRILIVPYMSRHAPMTAKAKELLDAGAIGRPINAHYHMLCPKSVALTRWFHEEEMSGGILVDTLTHGVDLFNWYFGPASRVSAFVTSSGGPRTQDVMEKDDNVAMVVEYASGVVATMRVSWTAAPTFPMVLFDILGTSGALKLDSPSSAVSYHRLVQYGQEGTNAWESNGRGHNEKQRYFVDVVQGKVPLTLSNPADAREALKVTLAGWRSAREGQVVVV